MNNYVIKQEDRNTHYTCKKAKWREVFCYFVGYMKICTHRNFWRISQLKRERNAQNVLIKILNIIAVMNVAETIVIKRFNKLLFNLVVQKYFIVIELCVKVLYN